MIYDITRELLSAGVYPGDPVPSMETVLSLENVPPDVCKLSRLTMGTHSGTHMDAPAHFCKDGKGASEVLLDQCMGWCKVITHNGMVLESNVDKWLSDGTKRLLIHGKPEIVSEIAGYMIQKGIVCIGVEMSTVASGAEQVKVHQILLGAEVVILESLELEVPDGNYFLAALPLKIARADGSPVRAVLLSK